ncbi:hypothetical protein [Bosea psychrotolerans]|uniref:N-acetyltransferase domain-containing protein n=1 Tax=Bosea psychrotolerans TaxID=1871628 RepID=A0A2S4MLA1_9HYPH|nr:hypothetical protein [Bosea psychrotolerans]POR55522.1 hypothetical protein CYD53_102412 [Bosea psychrotolerans]
MVDQDIFEAVRVTPAQARSAYSLVAMSHPQVGFDDWKRFLREAIRAGRRGDGIVGLRDRRGCIHALFAFRVVQALGRDATLQVTELALLRLPGTVLVKSLVSFARDLATELGLPSISIDMQPSDIWSQDQHALEQRGFALDRVQMRGPVRASKVMRGKP